MKKWTLLTALVGGCASDPEPYVTEVPPCASTFGHGDVLAQRGLRDATISAPGVGMCDGFDQWVSCNGTCTRIGAAVTCRAAACADEIECGGARCDRKACPVCVLDDFRGPMCVCNVISPD